MEGQYKPPSPTPFPLAEVAGGLDFSQFHFTENISEQARGLRLPDPRLNRRTQHRDYSYSNASPRSSEGGGEASASGHP